MSSFARKDRVPEIVSVAPMMECTDIHWRRFVREITRKTVLYTEMVVDGTLIHAPHYAAIGIGKNIIEHPSVIQLGGSEPELLGKAIDIVKGYGGEYQEINLNCGCPSQRVSNHLFGARLMLDPERVREVTSTMIRHADVPVTVKCRLGCDDCDSYDDLKKFIGTVHLSGVNKFIIHSRKCLLSGLTTKQNRDIPPLKYEMVHKLIEDFPDLEFILNGGIKTLQQSKRHLNNVYYPKSLLSSFDTYASTNTRSDVQILEKLDVCVNHMTSAVDCLQLSQTEGTAQCCPSLTPALCKSKPGYRHVDYTCTSPQEDHICLPPVHGIMIGRSAFSNPLLLASVDSEFYGVADLALSRRQILQNYIEYCEEVQSVTEDKINADSADKFANFVHSTASLLKPVQTIMNGLPHGGRFRTALNDLYIYHINSTANTNGVTISNKFEKKPNPNPSPRKIIEGAMEVIAPEFLDIPVTLSNEYDMHTGRMKNT